jgi:hypothetical protein
MIFILFLKQLIIKFGYFHLEDLISEILMLKIIDFGK